MLKIHTDFAALRRDNATQAQKFVPSEATPKTPDQPTDAATLTENHRAIAAANEAASQSRIKDPDSARAVSQALKSAISSGRQEALASIGGLTADRVKSLLQ